MDISELKALLEACHNSSYRWALSCCHRDAAEAEEVLQAVYLKVLEGKAHFRGESSFKTWLFSVIRLTAADERRRKLLRRLKLMRLAEHESLSNRPVHPDESVRRSETESMFRRALAELPRRQREALQLVFYHDLSVEEAAAVMKVSVGSARTHYERGKRKLRMLLEESESLYESEWGRKENPGSVR